MDMHQDGPSIRSEQEEKLPGQESVLENKSRFKSAEQEVYIYSVSPILWQEMRKKTMWGGGDHPLFRQRCAELGINLKG